MNIIGPDECDAKQSKWLSVKGYHSIYTVDLTDVVSNY